MTVSDFLDLVRRSLLVEEDQLTKFLGALSARNRGKLTEAVEDLSNEMVAADLLTEWQAERLQKRKYKGFLLGQCKLLALLNKKGSSHIYLAFHARLRRLVEVCVFVGDESGRTKYIVMEHKAS
jgi:hypothetical protein